MKSEVDEPVLSPRRPAAGAATEAADLALSHPGVVSCLESCWRTKQRRAWHEAEVGDSAIHGLVPGLTLTRRSDVALSLFLVSEMPTRSWKYLSVGLHEHL